MLIFCPELRSKLALLRCLRLPALASFSAESILNRSYCLKALESLIAQAPKAGFLRSVRKRFCF